MQTFKGRRGPPPGYLSDILTSSEPELSYRSSGIALLAAPDSRPRTKGEQGFSVRPSPKMLNLGRLNQHQASYQFCKVNLKNMLQLFCLINCLLVKHFLTV